MSELTAGREALDAIKALPPEDSMERLGTILERILSLAEGWREEYAGRNVSSEAEFSYVDGRDDAALEVEQALAAVANAPVPLPA